MVSKSSKFFQNGSPSHNHWRGIVLLGSNTQAFKFALAKNLFDLAKSETESINLKNLARPFSYQICRHLRIEDRQGLNPTSAFLDACRKYNEGLMDVEELDSVTLSQAFRYVLDLFHNVSGAETDTKFFTVEGTGNNRIVNLTKDMIRLIDSEQSDNLDLEIDARWNLVESAWSLKMNPGMIYHDSKGQLILRQKQRRRSVSGVREAISGYQKGHCFYCQRPFSLLSSGKEQTVVDHFFPISKNSIIDNRIDLDQIWNLVLTCVDCNMSKHDFLPEQSLLERLLIRSDYYINSNDPLKPTLENITGKTSVSRKKFHLDVWNELDSYGGKKWQSETQEGSVL